MTDLEIAAKAVGRVLKEALAPITARLDALEQRAQMSYRGVWRTDEAYRAGEFVTDKGSMWFVRRDCRGVRPGTDDTFQLAVKRGKDAG